MFFFWRKPKFKISQFVGGWKPSTPDRRDYSWNKIFGGSTPDIEDLPNEFYLPKKPRLPIQHNIPACVLCSFAFAQQYNEEIEHFQKVDLSALFGWLLTPHTPRGTDYRSAAKTVKDKGLCLHKLLPDNFHKGKPHTENKNLLTNKVSTEALRHRIKGYSFLDVFDLDSIKRAIHRGHPVLIAVGGNNYNWNNAIIEKNGGVVKPGKIDWYHSVCATGWKGNRMYFANWWGKKWAKDGYSYLDESYRLSAAMSIEDVTRGIRENIVKAPNLPAVYWIVNGIKHAFISAKVYADFFPKRDMDGNILRDNNGDPIPQWGHVKEIPEPKLNSIPRGVDLTVQNIGTIVAQ
ncbi:MAG: C1 family peptidase [Nanoarchaeota archaeon]|nr:C1 family peptidase [Nanoarchaeota archaeon]